MAAGVVMRLGLVKALGVGIGLGVGLGAGTGLGAGMEVERVKELTEMELGYGTDETDDVTVETELGDEMELGDT